MNRLKSKRSVNSSIYALLIVHCLLLLLSLPLQWPYLSTKSMHRIHATHETTETEYAISEITKPSVYCGEIGGFIFF